MKCSVCNAAFSAEEPAVLAVGRMGTPRYLCPDCDIVLETLTRGRAKEDIRVARDVLISRLENNPITDPIVNETVADLVSAAAERADAIENGTFDFAAEAAADAEAEQNEGIPEELQETEEDRALDQKEEETNKKLDKVFNWVWLAVFAGMLVAMVWFLFFR